MKASDAAALRGGRVAPVQERMDVDARDAPGRRQRHHRGQLALMAVHAARRQEAHDMQRTAAGHRGGDGRGQHWIAREFARGDRMVDAREVLVDDATGADVEMTDLRVAHLALGQAHVQFGGVDRRMR